MFVAHDLHMQWLEPIPQHIATATCFNLLLLADMAPRKSAQAKAAAKETKKTSPKTKKTDPEPQELVAITKHRKQCAFRNLMNYRVSDACKKAGVTCKAYGAAIIGGLLGRRPPGQEASWAGVLLISMQTMS